MNPRYIIDLYSFLLILTLCSKGFMFSKINHVCFAIVNRLFVPSPLA